MMKKLWAIVLPKFKIVTLLFLFIVSFIYAMFQGGFVSWFLFYAFTPFVIYSLLLSVYPLKNVEVHRRFHRHDYKAGEEMVIDIRIKRTSRMPLLYIVVEDQIPERFLTQFTSKYRAMLFPLFQKEITFSYTIPKALRGEHHFRGITIKTGDFLGLYEKKVMIDCYDYLLVYPRYEKMTFQQLESFYEQGQHTTPVRNHSETSIVTGVRNYMPGDKMSWIHWKATAKKNEIMTKDFEERKSQDVVIILDQVPSTHFEAMVSFVASLAHSVIQNGVGVAYVSTSSFHEPLLIGRGEQQRKKIFYQLAKVEDNEIYQLDHHLQFGKHSLPANASCIVVTSQLSKKVISSLSSLKGNASATLFVLKSNQENATFDNELKMEALMKGIKCNIVSPTSWEISVEEGKKNGSTDI